MRVLVGCEFSGTVRDAFASWGHDAWSCDILPSEKPGNHIQGDLLKVLNHGWDLLIAHPPCTYLTNSAEWAYKDPDFVRYPNGGYHQKLKPETLFGEARRQARKEAVVFFMQLWNSGIPRICIENPVGHISQHISASAAQTIQPHQFGEDASKGTCLWLRNLPRLIPTKQIPPRIVNGKRRWANQTDSGQNKLPQSDDRWALRSKTYPGMAEQWGLLA